MTIKCIALDLDGTTLYDDRHISQKNAQAIECAARAGIIVVAASGRCFTSLPESIKSFKCVKYAITSNGAAIYNMKTGEPMAAFPLAKADAERVIALSQGFRCTYEAFYKGVAYGENTFIKNPTMYGVDAPSVEYIRITRQGVDSIVDFIKLQPTGPDSMDIILPPGDDYNTLWSKMQQMREQVYITASVNHRIEISSLVSGKHKALEFLLKQLGIKKENAAAFGNADNDIDMIAYVKYGMAVANATLGCKNAAWAVVGDCRENGVAEGIERLMKL